MLSESRSVSSMAIYVMLFVTCVSRPVLGLSVSGNSVAITIVNSSGPSVLVWCCYVMRRLCCSSVSGVFSVVSTLRFC